MNNNLSHLYLLLVDLEKKGFSQDNAKIDILTDIDVPTVIKVVANQTLYVFVEKPSLDGTVTLVHQSEL